MQKLYRQGSKEILEGSLGDIPVRDPEMYNERDLEFDSKTPWRDQQKDTEEFKN